LAQTPLSGIQHSIRSGGYQAVIASVGATLRSLTYENRDLVVPFDADEVRPSHRGATLAPWPNRVVDGRYTFGGVERQLPLTAPPRQHPQHGLATRRDCEAVDKGPDHVTLAQRIEPQTAYPWRIIVKTTFRVDADGLTQTVSARNESAEPAPWGTGPHPYLVAGDGKVDDWTLELPAAEVLAVTPDRLIPTELVAVDADDPARFDFRVARPIASAEIDHAYTSLARDASGIATVRVTDAAGSGVAMSWDAVCPWVQVHTADRPGLPIDRIGLAVEPMTCAPDSFNAASYSYDAGLIVLEPGASAEASWRIAAV
jgi:aldose 1-epimerase